MKAGRAQEGKFRGGAPSVRRPVSVFFAAKALRYGMS